MLLVWGKKWYSRKLGFVGEFCEMCRQAQPFRLEQMTLTGHFWFVPMGSDHAVDHRATCLSCKTTVAPDMARFAGYASKSADTPTLLAQTFPRFDETWGPRLELERALRDDPARIAAADREHLLTRPFLVMSRVTEQRLSETHVDLRACLAILSIFVLPAIFSATWRLVSPDDEGVALLAGAGLGLGLSVWQVAQARSRWVRSAVASRLARCLAPLRPTTAEVDRIIALLRQHKHQLGKLLRSADVVSPRPA